MKYTSANLYDFEFHDAELSLVDFSDAVLTVSARFLNIHKGTEQNAHPNDMEIDHALITFYDFSLQSFDPGDVWTRDSDGKWFISEAGGVLAGGEALEKFLCELQNWINVFSFTPSENGSYCVEAGGFNEPWFEVNFTISSIMIEWDEYRKIAWYEETSWKN